jgi:hypothetical protein
MLRVGRPRTLVFLSLHVHVLPGTSADLRHTGEAQEQFGETLTMLGSNDTCLTFLKLRDVVHAALSNS